MCKCACASREGYLDICSSEATLYFTLSVSQSVRNARGVNVIFSAAIKDRRMKILVEIPCINEHHVYDLLCQLVCRSCIKDIKNNLHFLFLNGFVIFMNYCIFLTKHLLYNQFCLFVLPWNFRVSLLMDVVILINSSTK